MRFICKSLSKLLLGLPHVSFEDVSAALLVLAKRKAARAGQLVWGLRVFGCVASAAP